MSPRSKEQFEELREASVRKILDASLELFGTRGFEATSIAQIATQAGISKGLIYNYFESKEALLDALIQDLMKIGDDMITQIFTDDPRETIRRLIVSVFSWLKANDRVNRLIIGLSTSLDKFQFIHDIANSKMTGYLILLEDLMTKIGIPDPKTEARILATFFDGLALHFMMMKEDYPLEEVQQMLIDKYCNTVNP